MRVELAPGERVLYQTGKHWVIVLGPAVVFFISLLLLPKAGKGFWKSCCMGIILFAGIITLVLTLQLLFYKWYVTNRRVIKVAGIGVHHETACMLDKINNVTYHMTIRGRLLKFGDVKVLTASNEEIKGRYMWDPKRLVSEINKARATYQEELMEKHAKKIAEAMKSEEPSAPRATSQPTEQRQPVPEKQVVIEKHIIKEVVLVRCPECGAKYDETLPRCPRCGAIND